MNPVSTELWRKPETVPLSKFPESCHASIRKGISIIKGDIPQDNVEFIQSNEYKEGEATQFSNDEMNILRERLGVQLVHGDYSLSELKEIIAQENSSHGHSFKKR